MEQDLSQYLVYLHAASGGLALIAGGIALFARKGKLWHKKAGISFYYAMLFSATLALIVAALPSRQNSFLFAIGVFSTYFLLSGYRSLSFKRPGVNLSFDKGLAYLITTTGLLMLVLPILLTGKANVVLLVFGFVGLIFGIRDLRLFRDQEELKKKWLRLHLGKMTGGYIAAVSAFFVVNEILPGVWNWFVPGIIGSLFITYWMRIGINNWSAKR